MMKKLSEYLGFWGNVLLMLALIVCLMLLSIVEPEPLNHYPND